MAMLTAQSDEVKQGKLLFKEFSLDAAKAMLQFIYGDPLCFDALRDLSMEVLELANRYNLSDLKDICEKSLIGIVSKETDLHLPKEEMAAVLSGMIDLLKFAEQYDLSGLKEVCETWLSRALRKYNVRLWNLAELATVPNVKCLRKLISEFIVADSKQLACGASAVDCVLKFIYREPVDPE